MTYLPIAIFLMFSLSSSYSGEDILVPTGDRAGPIATKMWKTITDIQYGRVEHPWSVIVD